MEDIGPEQEVSEILGSLHAGLRSIEAAVSSLLDGMVTDNALLLAELDAALADAEAVLAAD